MASLYPVAGSAYTYVGRGLNAHLGFLAGWAMFLDYLSGLSWPSWESTWQHYGSSTFGGLRGSAAYGRLCCPPPDFFSV